MSKIYIISDCHGNIDGLMRALQNKKIVDKSGKRQLARKHQVISIGDLANCVEDSVGGDRECLNLVGEVIDSLLIGNHEFPYLSQVCSFNGFKFVGEISQKIYSLLNDDLIGPACLVGNTLITHAGLSKNMMPVELNPKAAFDTIEYHWKERNWGFSYLSGIGRARGGMNSVGGILWCDFEKEFIPTNFPQIVGHTPKYVRMKQNALCIDVGAKDQKTEPFILEVR